jgi:hypothetical protein
MGIAAFFRALARLGPKHLVVTDGAGELSARPLPLT